MKLAALHQGVRILGKYNSDSDVTVSVFGTILVVGVAYTDVTKADASTLGRLGWLFYDDAGCWGIRV